MSLPIPMPARAAGHAPRVVGALLRASYRSAATNRLQFALAIGSTLAMLAVTFFVTRELQDVVSPSLAARPGGLFGFVIVGVVAMILVQGAVTAMPSAIAGSLATGTLQAMLATPASLASLLAGLASYGWLWAVGRAVATLCIAVPLGLPVAASRVPGALLVTALLVLPYLAFGVLVAAALIAFRTAGPLPRIAIVLSTLLGGVYFPTHVIPDWLERFTVAVPLSHGLRALRGVLLDGASLGDVWPEVRTLLLLSLVLGALAVLAFHAALTHARRHGTLAQP